MSRPIHLLRSPHHLIGRFVWSLSAKPPTPERDAWAESQLLPGEVALWRRMPGIDRNHSIKVAQRFVAARPTASRAEIAGALLHDVGKIESGLGVWGRTTATIVGGRTKRFRDYLDHERIGSELAEQAGSEQATIDLVAERGPAFATLQAVDRT